MEFEDDPAKAARNLKKHKVSFEEAASVFGDPMSYTFADPDHSVGEVRWLMFGLSRMSRVLAVIYTHRGGQYRIISARLATKHERKIYEEG
ncbi:MAG: BrnT family toxin [Proteobacteria bacterium]|nr:BrnT family toxin [Pseudomonadota bacterium]